LGSVPEIAIQDQIPDNYCWGCGADNPEGLHLKSHWDGSVAVARFLPAAMFAAGPRHFLNGGIIATLLDCHGVCTAIAHAYDAEKRPIGSDPEIWCATTSMTVAYLRPTPIGEAVELTGRVLDGDAEPDDRATAVECVLTCVGKDRARATVRSVRVPEGWRHGSR
jgi:acyl-coenzyme A thioesterase PaaI-like protein